MATSSKALYAGFAAKKSAKRLSFIHSVSLHLQDQEIYKGLSRSSTEETFATRARVHLLQGIREGYNKEYPGREMQWYERKAEESLVWEHDKNATLHHTFFLGTQHRPDMYVQHNNDYRIAIEYKMVSSGDALRAALGQALVYAADYELTILALCDTTPDVRIKHKFDHCKGMPESALINKLWETFGTKIIVAAPRERQRKKP